MDMTIGPTFSSSARWRNSRLSSLDMCKSASQTGHNSASVDSVFQEGKVCFSNVKACEAGQSCVLPRGLLLTSDDIRLRAVMFADKPPCSH